MTTIADVAMNYLNQMHSPAQSAAVGYQQGVQQNQAQQALRQRQQALDDAKEQSQQQFIRDFMDRSRKEQEALAKKHAGMAMMSYAKGPTAYAGIQKAMPDVFGDINYEDLPTVAMQLAPEVASSYGKYQQEQADKAESAKLDREKFGETRRHNMAMENKKSGMTVYDSEGNPIVTMGGAEPVTKATQNKVQAKMLDIGDTLANVASIKSKFLPEYQMIGTRIGFSWDKMKDKLSDTPLASLTGTLSPEEAQALDDYTQYRAAAAQNFATTLKQMSGVAVNPTEFKRTEAWLPNPGTGIFDGDSPAELKAKIIRFEEFTKKAMMKYTYINNHGLSINAVDVEQMPYLMNRRGNEIAAKYEAQGLSGNDLNTAVKAALGEEFGLSY